MLVFMKQGVKSDSTTLSLFALTLSGVLGCIFMLPHPLCFYLQKFVVSDDPLIRNCLVLSTISATYPHILCAQITCMVTVYISMERAICVLFPLKVKLLIQYKNTVYILVFIFVAEIVGHIPYILNSPILWVPDQKNNGTLIAVNYQTPSGVLLYTYSNLFESNILIDVAMLLITISTIVTVTRIRPSSAWRIAIKTNTSKLAPTANQSSNNRKSENVADKISKKDKEIVKMVVSVTTCLLICMTCFHFPGLAMYAIPEFSLAGYNRELFQLFYTFRFILDSVNASLSFFFYVKQSSKYI